MSNQTNITKCSDCDREIEEWEACHTLQVAFFEVQLCDVCYNNRGLAICGICGEDYNQEDLTWHNQDLLCEICLDEQTKYNENELNGLEFVTVWENQTVFEIDFTKGTAKLSEFSTKDLESDNIDYINLYPDSIETYLENNGFIIDKDKSDQTEIFFSQKESV